MAYTKKFQAFADTAQARVDAVPAAEVAALQAGGAIVLDIRDGDEYKADHIPGALHISRGTLEMNIEAAVPDLDARLLRYCNANNRGALSAATLKDMGYRNASFIAGGLRQYRALTP